MHPLLKRMQDMVRTGLPGRVEDFIAYARSAAIAVGGAYGASRGATQIIIAFWLYAGILKYLQHFSPGRYPSTVAFFGSARGALRQAYDHSCPALVCLAGFGGQLWA